MIEVHKVAIQEKDGIKIVGVKYSKDGNCMPFTTIPYDELNDGQGDALLKQAVLDYLG